MQLIDEATFPRLYRIAMASPPQEQATEAEAFRWGLERILDSVQALITATEAS